MKNFHHTLSVLLHYLMKYKHSKITQKYLFIALHFHFNTLHFQPNAAIALSCHMILS